MIYIMGKRTAFQRDCARASRFFRNRTRDGSSGELCLAAYHIQCDPAVSIRFQPRAAFYGSLGIFRINLNRTRGFHSAASGDQFTYIIMIGVIII